MISFDVIIFHSQQMLSFLCYHFPFVRHRLGPEWDAWGNPQEWNWFLPLIKPLTRTRTLCDPAQTQVLSESSVVEHNLYFARLAIMG